MTDRRARPAVTTPTTSLPENDSGAHQEGAATVSLTPVAGTRPRNFSTTPPLVSGTVWCADLRDRAAKYAGLVSAVAFAKSEFGDTVKRDAKNGHISAAKNGTITFGDVFEVAKDWDEMGLTTIDEFLDAFECEVSGSGRSDAVTEVLRILGTESRLARAK